MSDLDRLAEIVKASEDSGFDDDGWGDEIARSREGYPPDMVAACAVLRVAPELIAVARAAKAEQKAAAALMLMQDTDIMDGKDGIEQLRLSAGWAQALLDAREARDGALTALYTKLAEVLGE